MFEKDTVNYYCPLTPREKQVIATQDYKSSNKSNIILPEDSERDKNRAVVVAVGPEVDGLKVGDEVLLPKFGSSVYEYNMQTYIFVKDEAIPAICNQETK